MGAPPCTVQASETNTAHFLLPTCLDSRVVPCAGCGGKSFVESAHGVSYYEEVTSYKSPLA